MESHSSLSPLEDKKQSNWIFCYWDEPTWIKDENRKFYGRKEQQTASSGSLPSIREGEDPQDDSFYKSYGR